MYSVQRQELLNCNQQFQMLQKQSIHDFLKTFGYVYEKEISRSSSSLVVQAISFKNNNSKVAIKILNQEYSPKINIQKLSKQVDFLESLKGEKYVLQFIERIQDLTYGITAIVAEYHETYFSFTRLIHSENSDQQQGNLSYQSPEVIDKKKPYKITADIFSIGVILLEALLQRKLKGMEYLKLKSQSLMSVLPDLLNEQNHQFVSNILSKMVDPDHCKRREPIYLLQLLNKLKVDQQHLKLIKLEKNIGYEKIQLQTVNQLGQEEKVQSISSQKIKIEQIKKAIIEKKQVVYISIDEEEDIIENQTGQQSVKVEFNYMQNQKTNMKNFEVEQIKPKIEIIQSSQNINSKENLRQIVKEENNQNISNEMKQIEQKKVQMYIEIDEEENLIETTIGQQNMKVEYNETSNQITNKKNGENQEIKPIVEIIQSSQNMNSKENLRQIVKQENIESISIEEKQNEQMQGQIEEVQKYVEIDEEENFIETQIGQQNMKVEYIETSNQIISMENGEDKQIKPFIEINKYKSDFEECQQSLMEIEEEDQQEINFDQEKEIINKQLNLTHIKNNKIQDKAEQEIMIEILKWKYQQNNNISQNYEIFLEKKEVQNDLNKLIKYLECNSFNGKGYEKYSQRILKIVDLIQIPQGDEDYEIIEIELKQITQTKGKKQQINLNQNQNTYQKLATV